MHVPLEASCVHPQGLNSVSCSCLSHLTPPTCILTKHQLEVTELSSDDARNESTAEDEGINAASRSRPPRPGDGNASVAARTRGTAGVKEGAATDQEEGGGGQRERGRPSSAQSAKSSSSKVEDELSVLRIGGMAGADGVSSGGDGPVGGLLDSGDHRGRQDSSRSPLPHENGAGGEDDASVLDTPLQDKVRDSKARQGKAHGMGGDAGCPRWLPASVLLLYRRCRSMSHAMETFTSQPEIVKLFPVPCFRPRDKCLVMRYAA